MELQLIPATDLKVDTRAQRAMDDRHMESLKNSFDVRKVGAVIVSERSDGSRYILDGQHRIFGAQGCGFDGGIPAIVHRGLTLAEEAELFLALNSNKAVPLMEKFKTRVTAGDKQASAVNHIVEDEGFSVGQAARSDHSISAVAQLEAIYRNSGHRALRYTLQVIREAWQPLSVQARSARILAAVSTVVSAPGVELDRLIGALSKTTANVIMADADFMVDMHSHLTKRKADAEVVLKAYNKGLRREDRVVLDAA